MRAVVLDAVGLPGLAEVPDPAGPGDLVRVLACGLCGSDVEKLGRPSAGAVLGHEVEGLLEDGTRVTVMHRVPCGDCDRCRAGHESTCNEFQRLRIEPGGFAERLRATHVVPLPASVHSTGSGSSHSRASFVPQSACRPDGVLVVGCGAVGQLWVQVLRGRGDEVRGDRSARRPRRGGTSARRARGRLLGRCRGRHRSQRAE